MHIIWTCGDETGRCTLDQFFADNETIDDDQRGDIITTLDRGASYLGGGGAGADWSLRCDPDLGITPEQFADEQAEDERRLQDRDHWS